jgi:hypothetical protein
MGRLVLLVAVILVSSAAMSNGIRTAGTVAGDGGAPAGPAVVTTQTAVEVRTPPVLAVAAAKVSSDHQAPLDDDPDKDSKRKVPNGQDPIHNRYESLIPNHFLILDNKSNLCLRP